MPADREESEIIKNVHFIIKHGKAPEGVCIYCGGKLIYYETPNKNNECIAECSLCLQMFSKEDIEESTIRKQ